MYYKLGRACVRNWCSFVLLQIRANVVTNSASFVSRNCGKSFSTNWDSCYKLGQPEFQNRTAVTNWKKCVTNWGRNYKLGQLLKLEHNSMHAFQHTRH